MSTEKCERWMQRCTAHLSFLGALFIKQYDCEFLTVIINWRENLNVSSKLQWIIGKLNSY